MVIFIAFSSFLIGTAYCFGEIGQLHPIALAGAVLLCLDYNREKLSPHICRIEFLLLAELCSGAV
jgi:hypothetical protein